MKRILLGISVILFIQATLSAQTISVSNGTGTAASLVNTLVGSGVTVSNISYVGFAASYSPGTGDSPHGNFSNGSSTLGISSGVLLSCGSIFTAPGPNNSDERSRAYGGSGDATLNAVLGGSGYTYDACGIQFDFIPQGEMISFRYVFASEEYNEWVGSFNDIFGFFVTSLESDGYGYSSKNIALVPGTSTPVSINNINKSTNAAYFKNNDPSEMAPPYNIQADGITTVLTASLPVTRCKNYRMKLVVADVSDDELDTYVFLEGGSLSSPMVTSLNTTYSPPAAGTDAVENCNNAIITFNLSGPAPSGGRKIPFVLGGTATEVRFSTTDYSTSPNIVPTYNTSFANKYYVTVPSGQTSTTLTFIPTWDGTPEGTETITATVDMNFCTSGTVNGSLNIRDNSVMTASLTTTDPIISCSGPPGANLGASGSGGFINPSYTYVWAPTTGLSNPNIANPVATPSVETIYTVTVSDACGATATNDVSVVFYHSGEQIGLWIGNVDSNWDNCSNWGSGKVPDATIDVVIPSSLGPGCVWPVKTGNLVVGTNGKSITMNGSSYLTITGNLTINASKTFVCNASASVTVGGNWVDNGTFARGTSTVTFNGAATQSVNSGINKIYSFWDLIIDGTDVIFYYNAGSSRKINANNITINTTKKMTTVQQ